MWLPWHENHDECELRGRRNPQPVPSFTIMLYENDNGIMNTLEETIIAGCSSCTILGKITRYMRDRGAIRFIDALELVTESDDGKHTTVVTPDHGTVAHHLQFTAVAIMSMTIRYA
jgi:hypothetical protein